jgi:hypothetical protein
MANPWYIQINKNPIRWVAKYRVRVGWGNIGVRASGRTYSKHWVVGVRVLGLGGRGGDLAKI